MTTQQAIDLGNKEDIQKRIQENGGKPITVSVYVINGVFGELDNCAGVAEDIINTDEKLIKYGLDPAEGGTFLKLLGCSYLYKGDPRQERVFGIEQAKSNISTIPRDIIGRSWLLSGACAALFLFRRRKAINLAHIFFEEIKHKTIRHHGTPDIRLNKFAKEIRRAMDVALKDEFKIDPNYDLYNNTTPQLVKYTDLDLAGLMTKIVAFIVQIMDLDGAYRFPTQDILGNKNTENAKKSGVKEARRLMALMIERQTNLTPVEGVSIRTSGVPHKFRFINLCLNALFFISPRARRITQKFLVEMDEVKVGLDEADWYFCLRRNTHNYGGVPLPQRLAELERIDNVKKHQYVKIEYKVQPAI